LIPGNLCLQAHTGHKNMKTLTLCIFTDSTNRKKHEPCDIEGQVNVAFITMGLCEDSFKLT